LIQETTINFILQGDWCHFCTWVDVLWFAFYTENKELKSKATEILSKLINLDNVIPVLITAHCCEEKELRSKCIDFMVIHGAYIEEFQRMRENAEVDVRSVGGLSISIKDEFTKKVQQRVSNLRSDSHLPQPKTKVTIFNKKKANVYTM